MSHQVRARCPVSGLNFDRSCVDEEGCFPSSPSQLSQPLCEVSRASTTVSVLQMTKAKSVATSALYVNYQLCANSEGGFCVNCDSTISCSPPTGQALFPAHRFISWFLKCHLWRVFWRFDLGGESCGIFSMFSEWREDLGITPGCLPWSLFVIIWPFSFPLTFFRLSFHFC